MYTRAYKSAVAIPPLLWVALFLLVPYAMLFCYSFWSVSPAQVIVHNWNFQNYSQLVRNPIYSGQTPEFWRSCDAVAGPAEWKMWGVVNCGKGQPSQLMHVGHGAAPCRFRNVRVEPAR